MPISITYPSGTELLISTSRLVRRVGHKAAGLVRKRLRAGMGSAHALPVGDGTPLRDTGRLINSIKFMPRGKTSGIIFATGTRDNGKSNAKILGIQLARGTPRGIAMRAADPLGVDAAMRAAVLAEANAEIRKQIAAKETRIKAKRRKKA